jgi:hypothetical protein
MQRFHILGKEKKNKEFCTKNKGGGVLEDYQSQPFFLSTYVFNVKMLNDNIFVVLLPSYIFNRIKYAA